MARSKKQTAPSAPPDEAIRKPFWIMKILSASMKEPGNYLTSLLFIPSELW